MDPNLTSQFLKDLAVGFAEKIGIGVGLWLVSQKLIPAAQLTTAETVVGYGVLAFAVFGYTWWRTRGKQMLMRALKAEVPPGYVPAPQAAAQPATPSK